MYKENETYVFDNNSVQCALNIKLDFRIIKALLKLNFNSICKGTQ